MANYCHFLALYAYVTASSVLKTEIALRQMRVRLPDICWNALGY